MTVYTIVLPYLSPDAFSLGPLSVKWYALAYLVGILYGYFFLAKQADFTQKELDAFFYYVTLGVIVGGRLGYTLFYNLPYYAANPFEILMLWKGGMSFHGGLLGVLLGLLFFSHNYQHHFLYLTDLCASTVSLGIFLGRIANFINAELYGRTTQYSWGVIFPNSDGIPRHPVQIYEALLEGLLLFLMMQLLFFSTSVKKYHGILSGIWLTSYGLARVILENFREPDQQIGYFFNFITMGQILSLPMIVSGAVLIVLSVKVPRDQLTE